MADNPVPEGLTEVIKHIKQRFPDANTYDATTLTNGDLLVLNSKNDPVAMIIPPHEGDNPFWRWKDISRQNDPS